MNPNENNLDAGSPNPLATPSQNQPIVVQPQSVGTPPPAAPDHDASVVTPPSDPATTIPASPTPVTTEPSPAAPLVSQFPQANSSAPSPLTPPPTSYNSKKPNKKLFAIAGGGLLAMLLLGGFVFGYYIPNKPQNVYKTGLNRSGQAVNKIVTKATEKQTLDAVKKSEMTVDVTATLKDASYSGNLSTKFDTTKADGNLKVTAKHTGDPDKVFTTKFLGELKAGSKYPSIYLQFAGVKAFGFDSTLPGIANYENKWISIDETYLKSLGLTEKDVSDSQKKQITAEDIAEEARALASVTTDYVLTANPQKAVFEQKKFVGKEKVDGRSAYHYLMGINKTHAGDYCKAVVDKVTETQIYKKLASSDSQSLETAKKEAVTGCQDSVKNDIKDTDTFDLWIDAGNKLIYKIRVTDKDNNKSYLDIGQNYKGGDDISLFVNAHDEAGQSDTKATLSTNIKTHVTTGSLKLDGSKSDDAYKVEVTLSAKPYNGDIKVDKPADAVPIQDILQKLGLGGMIGLPTNDYSADASSDAAVPNNAADTERTTDIKALHAQLEAYYAENGSYPSLSDLNDSNWLKTNMKGLDKEALKDPKGTNYTLAALPAPNVYAYTAMGDDGKPCSDATNPCAKYTLTAQLSDGSKYTKQDLN